MTESGKFERSCYQCGKEIQNISGKYFCSRECWDKYGENQDKKKPQNAKLTIKEIQEMFRNKTVVREDLKTPEEKMREVGMI